MKKRTLSTIFFVVATMVCATIVLSACDFSQQSDLALFDDVVRIHIRANSNSDEDQSVKLKVRDAVTEYLTNRLSACVSKKEAYMVLEKEKENVAYVAQQTLLNNNFDYKATIVLHKEHFPEKNYDGYVFPEGDYDALVVNLGSGNGDNWWCVAFPPLCFVPDSKDGEKIVYKSWVKEQLDKIFGKS